MLTTTKLAAAIDCEVCGKKIATHRLGRARRYCSGACRQSAFRNAKFDPPYSRSGTLRNASKTSTNSIGCKPENGDRGFPVSLPRDILGGNDRRWPNSIRLKPAKWSAIVSAEIGDRWTDWPPTTDVGSR